MRYGQAMRRSPTSSTQQAIAKIVATASCYLLAAALVAAADPLAATVLLTTHVAAAVMIGWARTQRRRLDRAVTPAPDTRPRPTTGLESA